MSDNLIRLTEEQYDAAFTLVRNHLNPNASWGFDDGPGCLFETYGEELAFIQRQSPNRVWTLIDGDDGDLYVVSGAHLVNRIGYLLSHDSFPENTLIEVHIPMERDNEGESQ